MNKIIAKKSLGQNFLKDEKVIEEICVIAEVEPTDWVLEIGPGTGALTGYLSPRVEKLLAIELDHELVERLQQHFIESKHVSILEGNILEIHIQELLEHSGFAKHTYKVIANIPYYITAPIIRMLLSIKNAPESLTLMVQDEVADRLSAQPGDMSLLSVMAQYYARVEKKLFVPREAFDPVPQVDSAVVHIAPYRPYDQEKDRRVFRLVRAGFAARRKTLVNNLMSNFEVSREVMESRLAQLGLRSDIRAQALSIADWEKLAELWTDETS